ncbi:hypothetical protein GCM10008012_45400 [Rhizobium anhuiense]|nr:hypothetical protein GCM10008012_45400 [Rhizobium anhuiense]
MEMYLWFLNAYYLSVKERAERCQQYNFMNSRAQRRKRQNLIVHMNENVLPIMRDLN